jgi:hypothetical protein
LIADTDPFLFYVRILPLTIMIVVSGTSMADNMRQHATGL